MKKYIFYITTLVCSAMVLLQCTSNSDTSEYITAVLHDRVVLEGNSEKLFGLNEGDKLIYLIRHAEKDTVDSPNPGLTEEGIKRAATLANLFRKTRIDAVYSTFYMRTLLTVDSLVKSKGMSIKAYDPAALSAFADSLLTSESLHSVMVVGHSNTTPELAKLLSGSEENLVINEDEYDYIYMVIARKQAQNDFWKLKFRSEY